MALDSARVIGIAALAGAVCWLLSACGANPAPPDPDGGHAATPGDAAEGARDGSTEHRHDASALSSDASPGRPDASALADASGLGPDASLEGADASAPVDASGPSPDASLERADAAAPAPADAAMSPAPTQYSSNATEWAVPPHGTDAYGYNGVTSYWNLDTSAWASLDMDGDGRPDLVDTIDPSVPYTVWGGNGASSFWKVYRAVP